ncbi:acyl-CoA dehydrogenase family member 9, mitochondrial [Cephus cinctus]|uniref:Acyl-CoA dehydrogenase family member 9, mitochondrial n=1 Tax=Cephus cinctus TaxID=211228 RepID=A0AAJ7BP40_CEPCN|nr:acyl-CoA dehydrogenase family member 9, mitochondrial [Cephus cinctus]
MLTRNILPKQSVLRFKNRNGYPRRYSHSAPESAIQEIYNLEKKLPALLAKKPRREPFVKNFFIGKFDTEFLVYPEAHSNDRNREFNSWLKPIEEYVKKNINGREIDEKGAFPEDLRKRFQDFGISRARIDELYNGINLTSTEFVKLVETVSLVPSLGSYLLKQVVMPVELLTRYGSVEQKLEYLPKIASGEIIPAIAITEASSGPNATKLNTIASYSVCGEYLYINGEKTFVSNGPDADFFIVFANCTQHADTYKTDNSLTAILVERDHGGITSSKPIETLGQRGLKTSTITFKDTKVPVKNILGNLGQGPEILKNMFNIERYNIGGQAIAILKNFLNILTVHVLRRKHFNRMLYQYQSTQKILADITMSLYAMESITYLTTGMADIYDDQDIIVESTIVESYCTNECVKNIYKAMQLIGAQSYLKENPFERIYRDALGMNLFDCSNIDTSIYTALLGLQHAGIELYPTIMKERNPAENPAYTLKNLFFSPKKEKLKIHEYLHPSLSPSADVLEFCINQVKTSAKLLLNRYGTEVSEKQMDLLRLNEMATLSYVVSAVLGRASRAYCTGIKNSEQDMRLSMVLTVKIGDRVKFIAQEIEAGELVNGDYVRAELAELTVKNQGYIIDHPLVMNV